MEKAIKIAIENGYTTAPMSAYEGDYGMQLEAFLDPFFWQALGKGLGWEQKMVVRRGVVIGLWAVPTEQVSFKEVDYQMDYVEGWSYHWHRFIDHIIEGKDINSFFEELTK